jgi:glycerophosphoryl diester phosphodiesterase
MIRALLATVLFVTTFLVNQAIAFDFQGHRGARGLMPENTLPAFAKALDLGVTTLELDLAMTADGELVVSHDAVLNPAHTRFPGGTWLVGDGPAILSFSVDELQTYDVGRLNPDSRYARRFPDQTAVDGAKIPTLKQVFDLTRQRGADAVRFNMETKIRPDRPDLTTSPQVFAEAIVRILKQEGMTGRSTVQSFDWRTLIVMQKLAPDIPTVYLSAQQTWLDNIQAGEPGASPWTAGLDVDDYAGSVPKAIKAAGGQVWSPYWKNLTADSLKEAQGAGLEVVVWTVNDPADMARMMDMGVDGIITDYPDRLRALLDARGYARNPKTGAYELAE